MNRQYRLGPGRGSQVVYPQPLVRWRAPGEVELTDVQPGPAGSAAVVLPDGTVCEVDHADPHLLVQLTLPASAPERVVRRWVGTRDTEPGWGSPPDDPVEPDRPARRPFNSRELAARMRRGGGVSAIAVGRAVLAADLLDDAELPELVRLTSGAELLLALEQDPDLEPLEPLRVDLREQVEQLATWIDDELAELGPESLRSASRLLGLLVESLDPPSVPLERLLARVRRAQEWFEISDVAAMQASEAPAGFDAYEPTLPPHAAHLWSDELADEAGPPDDFLEITRIQPALLRVTVSRAAPGDWVRVLRKDGLVLLAAAPLVDDRLLRAAELIVPPDTVDDELIVQVVDADDVDLGPTTTDLIRDAVHLGRHAARAERLGRIDDAHERWHECAALWDRAGDEHRALLARQRAEGGAAPAPVGALLCDELVEDLLGSHR